MFQLHSTSKLLTSLLFGIIIGITSTLFYYQKKSKKIKEIKDGFVDLIGNTPLVKLESLSRATGCTILISFFFFSFIYYFFLNLFSYFEFLFLS